MPAGIEAQVKPSDDAKTVTVTLTSEEAISVVTMVKALAMVIKHQLDLHGIDYEAVALSAEDKMAEIKEESENETQEN